MTTYSTIRPTPSNLSPPIGKENSFFGGVSAVKFKPYAHKPIEPEKAPEKIETERAPLPEKIEEPSQKMVEEGETSYKLEGETRPPKRYNIYGRFGGLSNISSTPPSNASNISNRSRGGGLGSLMMTAGRPVATPASSIGFRRVTPDKIREVPSFTRPRKVVSPTFKLSIPKTSNRDIEVLSENSSRRNSPEVCRKISIGGGAPERQPERQPERLSERKITVKSNIPKIRTFSMAQHKNADGSEVDWNNLNDEETVFYTYDYRRRIANLSNTHKKFKIQMPEEDMSLGNLVKYHKECVHTITVHNSTSNWKAVTVLGYYVIEFIMTKWLKLSVFKGFGKFQYNKMYLYEMSMIELGEMFTSEKSAEMAPHWKIAQITAIQTSLFLVAGIFSKYFPISSGNILAVIDRVYKPVPEGSRGGASNDVDPPVVSDSDNTELISQLLNGMMNGIGQGGAAATNDAEFKNFDKGSDATKKADATKEEPKSSPQKSKPKSAFAAKR